jgi:hypothetical protein
MQLQLLRVLLLRLGAVPAGTEPHALLRAEGSLSALRLKGGKRQLALG